MSKRKHDRCRLGLEMLEGRLMLDGNVAVQVVEGNLSIVGDRLDNAVEVRPAEIEGSYVITGRPTGAATDVTAMRPTLINGSKDPLTVQGVTGDVRVDLRAGNDSILFGYPPNVDILERPLSVPNNLSINDGSGADQITLRSLTVGKDLRIISLGGNDWISAVGAVVGGNDRIEIVGGKVGGNARIVTGAGDDTVALTGLQVAGDLSVSTSLGNDRVTLSDVGVTGDVAITTSLGNDEVAIQAKIGGDLVVNAGCQVCRVQPTATGAAIVPPADADSVSAARTTVGGNVKISTASGDDKVAIDWLTAAGSFVAETGDGNDKVTVGEIASMSANPGGLSPQILPTLTAASVGIRTGAGNDEVKLFQTAVDRLLAVDLGLGADVLRAEGNVVTGMAWLNGGLGFDALYNYNNKFGQVRITGFEKIDPATEPGSVAGSRGGVVLFPLRPGGGIIR